MVVIYPLSNLPRTRVGIPSGLEHTYHIEVLRVYLTVCNTSSGVPYAVPTQHPS